MTDSSAPTAGAAAPVSTDPAEGKPDAHGHDPADYRWVPVRRRRRPDGWSNAKQIAFIEALSDCGSVAQAAQEVGMSVTSCYRLRRAADAENFARAWQAAIEQASQRLVDVAFERAFNGGDEPVFDRDGRRVGRRIRYNDQLLMFLLRAHRPERYAARPDPAPRPAPVAEAIARLEPAPPPDPHLLMAPDALADALLVADLGNGELPHWYRDPDPVPIAGLGEEFERALEAAKREASPDWPGWDEEEEEDDRD